MAHQPLILLTNDDGYDARGIEAMAAALRKFALVVVVAPEMEQSACSHKLTLHRGLRLRKVRDGWFKLDGTPADCVYVSLFSGTKVLPRRPDLVVSGMNAGPNLGLDVYYSGTVAAAREAAMRGVVGVAVSADVHAEVDGAAEGCATVVRATLACCGGWDAPTVLNVNVPFGRDRVYSATRPGRRVYGEGVEYREDPRGGEYLWIGGPGVRNEGEPGTDTHAFDHGRIGVSNLPLRPGDVVRNDPAEVVVREVQRGVDGTGGVHERPSEWRE